MKTDSRFFAKFVQSLLRARNLITCGKSNLKAPKQTTLIKKNSGNQVDDSFMLEFTDAWICAGLPLNALGDPKLKAVLEKGFKKPIPSITCLSQNYADRNYRLQFDKVKEIVSNSSAFYIAFDEAEFSGDKYYAFLIGQLCGDETKEPYLLDITKDNRPANALIVQQKLLAALSKIGCVNESDYGKFRLFLTDAVAYNISASQSLVLTFPNFIHVTCISHMLARITSVLPKEAKVCKQLMKKFNKLFKSCITVLLWKGFEVRTADFVKNTVVVK